LPPSRELYRIGYKPGVWALPDWKYISSVDGIFPNRYDDPEGEYRVLYAASQRLACFVEVLAPLFRVAPEVAAGLAEIEGPDDFLPVQTLPRMVVEQRLEPRQMGMARMDLSEGNFAEVCTSQWVSRLRAALLPRFFALGIESFDVSTLLASSPRRLTQLVSRYVYEIGLRVIRYPSKHGTDLENWAFLDWVPLTTLGVAEIRLDDPDLLEALRLHFVQLEP
jgi:hypothetical protein